MVVHEHLLIGNEEATMARQVNFVLVMSEKEGSGE